VRSQRNDAKALGSNGPGILVFFQVEAGLVPRLFSRADAFWRIQRQPGFAGMDPLDRLSKSHLIPHQNNVPGTQTYRHNVRPINLSGLIYKQAIQPLIQFRARKKSGRAGRLARRSTESLLITSLMNWLFYDGCGWL
jgi:hypothetical protein